MSAAKRFPRFVVTALIGLGGCDQIPRSIGGDYTKESNPGVTLNITSNKITVIGGVMAISADYVIKSVEGNKLLIEVSAPQTRKDTAELYVNKSDIWIRHNFLFAGEWKRR